IRPDPTSLGDQLRGLAILSPEAERRRLGRSSPTRSCATWPAASSPRRVAGALRSDPARCAALKWDIERLSPSPVARDSDIKAVMHVRWVGIPALGSILLALTSCGGSSPSSARDGGKQDVPTTFLCTPGQSIACVGPGGCAGGQSCKADGSGYEPCDCGGSSTPDAATDSADGGSNDGASGDSPDGAATCDPLSPPGQQGCSAGQKCTWILLADTPAKMGRIGCVPDGTIAIGQACTVGAAGATTGYEACVSGTVCVGGFCPDNRGFAGSARAPGEGREEGC